MLTFDNVADVPFAESAQPLRAERSAAQASLALIAGVLLSGPLALALVAAIHAQPSWSGAARFATEFHPVQLVPYLGGFLLVGASMWLVATLRVLTPFAHKSRATFAVALVAMFGALISLNYILQTTFVPSLVRPYRGENDLLIAAFSMANPRSLAWSLEMWGYAVLGASTWAAAGVFDRTRIERFAALSYVANGVTSIVGAIATICWPAWTLSLVGIVAFAAWNLLVVVMGVLTFVAMRRRIQLRTNR